MRVNEYRIIAVFTGHLPIWNPSARLGISYDSHCRRFGNKGGTFLCNLYCLRTPKSFLLAEGESFYPSCRLWTNSTSLGRLNSALLALATTVIVSRVSGIKTAQNSINCADAMNVECHFFPRTSVFLPVDPSIYNFSILLK